MEWFVIGGVKEKRRISLERILYRIFEDIFEKSFFDEKDNFKNYLKMKLSRFCVIILCFVSILLYL